MPRTRRTPLAKRPPKQRTKSLGPTQRAVLECFLQHSGSWYRGCGWLWDTWSRTERIMESLHRRGMLDRVKTRLGRTHIERVLYSINDRGRRELNRGQADRDRLDR